MSLITKFAAGVRSRVRIVVPLVCALATVAVWYGLRLHERQNVFAATRFGMATVKADFISDTEVRVLGLIRMARRNMSEYSGRADWEATARLYMAHSPGCLEVDYVDLSHRVHWAVAADRSVLPEGTELTDHQRPALRQAMQLASQQGQPHATPAYYMPNGRVGQWFVVPGTRDDRLHGYVLALFDTKASLSAMLADVADLGYSFHIRQGSIELFRFPDRPPEPGSFQQSRDVELAGISNRLTVWPQPTVVAQSTSYLPEAALVIGALLSILLTVIVRLVEAERGHSRELRAVNERLLCEVAERRRAETALSNSQARLAAILDTSAEAVISTDEHGRITLFNQGAERMFGYRSEEMLGRSVGELIPVAFRESHRQIMSEFAVSEKPNVYLHGHQPILGLRKNGNEFPAEGSISKLEFSGEKVLTAVLRDITDRKLAEEALRESHDELERRVKQRTKELGSVVQALQGEVAERRRAEETLSELSGRLLQLQDEERRRIARELHDSTAQILVSLSMTLSSLEEHVGSREAGRKLLADSSRLLEQAISELRTLAYLLHPPMLDDLGLTSALRWYVTGFQSRSGVTVDLETPKELGRLPRDAELTLFRIVQEALTNIHRHSRSLSACITLEREGESVCLTVADEGVGMPAMGTPAGASVGLTLGVGIAGMRERVRQLGGSLEITSAPGGTRITVRLPAAGSSASSRLSAVS